MARIKLEMPSQFVFTAMLPIRITDLNYGNHVGNDSVLSLLHEARVQFLHWAGYTELDLAGVGLIMADVAIEFRQEIFYGDSLEVKMVAGEFSRVGFDIYYRLEKCNQEGKVLAVQAKTGMVCFDYAMKKVTGVPAGVAAMLGGDGTV